MKFDTRAHCYMLIIVLMFNFLKYFPLINFWDKFNPKICFSKYLLKFNIERYHVIPSIWRKHDQTKFVHNILNTKVLKILELSIIIDSINNLHKFYIPVKWDNFRFWDQIYAQLYEQQNFYKNKH